MHVVAAAVGHVQQLAVAAGVQAVRADTGLDEAGLLEAVAVNHMHAVGHHVGDIEGLAVG